MQYVGCGIEQGLLKLQEKKVEAVCQYPHPSKKKQVCIFLGFASYYCYFMPIFVYSCPLSELTRKGEPEKVNWTLAAERA